MSDITMCDYQKCPKKENCYRFKATPSKHQSYFYIDWQFEKMVLEDNCGLFWEFSF